MGRDRDKDSMRFWHHQLQCGIIIAPRPSFIDKYLLCEYCLQNLVLYSAYWRTAKIHAFKEVPFEKKTRLLCKAVLALKMLGLSPLHACELCCKRLDKVTCYLLSLAFISAPILGMAEFQKMFSTVQDFIKVASGRQDMHVKIKYFNICSFKFFKKCSVILNVISFWGSSQPDDRKFQANSKSEVLHALCLSKLSYIQEFSTSVSPCSWV